MSERKPIQITKHDATMLALYLVVIALGAMMTARPESFVLGIIQILVGALFFGLRLRRLAE